MIQSEHISREELHALLASELGSAQTQQCEDHLQQCESCRLELDRLAAHSEVWQKTPRLLRQGSQSSNFIDLASGELETRELTASKSNSGEEGLGMQVDSLLESPKHPEMIGRIGRYDIEKEIGRGGMGIVYKAHDAELNRPLAIKVLAPHLANYGPARQRFAQEARAAAGVLHPNVIAVHDVSNEGKTPFIVMPYIAGLSLQALVEQNGPIDEIEIVRMALQIAAGLTPAHSQGLVHRDIKPANILVERGANRVIITDFGLARAEDDASLTRTGWLTGTPNYMSPEQTRGERLDHRSDLFSFGSMLYFLATGRLPFRAESPLGVLNRIQNEAPTPVREVNGRISKTLANIIHALLKKDAAHRYQSAGDLHDVLEQHLAHLHQPELALPPKVIGDDQSAWKSYLVFGSAVALMVAAGISFAFGFLEPQAEIGLIGKKTDEAVANSPGSITDQNATNQIFVAQESNAPSNAITLIARPSRPFANEIYRVVSSLPIDKSGRKKFNAGMEALAAEEWDQALELFTEAATHKAFEQKATYNLGCVWALQGDEDKALKYLNQAIDLGFVDLQQYQNDSDLVSLRNSELFDEVMQRVKTLAQAEELVSRGKSLVSQDQMDEAIELLTEALAIDEDNAQAMVNLGYAIHQNGDLDEALKWHMAAAGTDSQAALGSYNAGCVFALRGDKDKALAFLDRAMEAGLADVLGYKHVSTDADLQDLHDEPKFNELLKELQAAQKPTFGSYFQVREKSDDFMQIISTDWKQFDDVHGEWECLLMGHRVRLSLTQDTKGSDVKWGFTSEFDASEFEPNIRKVKSEFKLAGRPGTLVFTGAVNGRRGKGDFIFQSNSSYIDELAAKGIENVSDALLFRLFMSRQDEEEYIENLKQLQGLDLDEKTLGTLMVHNVEAGLVANYQECDFDAEDHLLYLVWRVDPSLLKQYKKAGLINLDDYKSFINHRVNPRLLKSYINSGFALKDYERFIVWRVEPSLLKRYQKADLDLHENDEFINRRVEPVELKRYRKAGLDLDQYREFVFQRVPPTLITSYTQAGIDLQRYEELLQSRVDAQEVLEYKKAGLLDGKYRRFLTSRVPVDLLRSYQDSEYEPLRHKEFIQRHVPVEVLQRYEKAGLDLEQHKDAIYRRMDPKKILDKIKQRGR